LTNSTYKYQHTDAHEILRFPSETKTIISFSEIEMFISQYKIVAFKNFIRDIERPTMKNKFLS